MQKYNVKEKYLKITEIIKNGKELGKDVIWFVTFVVPLFLGWKKENGKGKRQQ